MEPLLFTESDERGERHIFRVDIDLKVAPSEGKVTPLGTWPQADWEDLSGMLREAAGARGSGEKISDLARSLFNEEPIQW